MPLTMIVDTTRIVLFEVASILLFVLLVIRILSNRYAYGLSAIPGPSVASLTDFWRLFNVWGRRPEQEHIALHKRYGPVVRVGPKAVSISDPNAVQIVYGLNTGFTKSEF